MHVSVIIASYNCADYLGRAIRSVINQSLNNKDYEIIVIDDGSTDHTNKILEDYNDYIKVIEHKKNKGLAFSCNEGIKKAIGTHIIRVDADDYINGDLLLCLSLILNYNKDISFVWTDHYLIDENENIINTVNIDEINPLKMLAAGVMFRKSVIEKVGLYDEAMSGVEGEDLLMRILSHHENYQGFHLPLPFYRYMRHDNNMTNNKDEMKHRYRKLTEKIGKKKKP